MASREQSRHKEIGSGEIATHFTSKIQIKAAILGLQKHKQNESNKQIENFGRYKNTDRMRIWKIANLNRAPAISCRRVEPKRQAYLHGEVRQKSP